MKNARYEGLREIEARKPKYGRYAFVDPALEKFQPDEINNYLSNFNEKRNSKFFTNI